MLPACNQENPHIMHFCSAGAAGRGRRRCTPLQVMLSGDVVCVTLKVNQHTATHSCTM